MTTTDIDGSPLLILSKREAKALCEYFQDENFFRNYAVLTGVWSKAEKVANDDSSRRGVPAHA